MLAARDERESRAKELKSARKEYKAQMNVFRMRGSCLDWCNLGKCSFGGECQFKHDEEDKGSLVALAAKIKAANVGGRTGEKDERRVTKIREAREARETAGDAGEAGDVGSGSRSAKKTSLLGALSDDSDSDSDSDSDADADAKTKKSKKKVLSVLPGDDGGDDSSDDEAVPKIVRARLARRREDERDAKASRERRREEKAKAMKAKNGEERARTKQAPSGCRPSDQRGWRKTSFREAAGVLWRRREKKEEAPAPRRAARAKCRRHARGEGQTANEVRLTLRRSPRYKIFHEGPCA